MLALFAAAALVAYVLFKGGTSGPSVGGSAPLNALRRQALAILDTVVPSAYGDARFAKLGWAPVPGTRITSCGALPCKMGRDLGDPEGITRCGVPGVRTEGLKRHAWITPGQGRRPKPGDILLTSKDPAGQVIAHTCVLKAIDGNAWRTADAGQGTVEHQEAAYVNRVYDPVTNTLMRAGATNAEPRFLVGWTDLDLAMANRPKGFVEAPSDSPWPCDPQECQ